MHLHKDYIFALIVLAALLGGCAGVGTPAVATATEPYRPPEIDSAMMPPTWTPEPTRTARPRPTATPSPQPTSAPTLSGLSSPYLTGVEALLPEGSQVQRERAWPVSAREVWAGFYFVPFLRGDDQDLALVGLPRGSSGGWDRKTLILLWTWSSQLAEQPLAKELRALPYAPGQAQMAFLAQGEDGGWRVVPVLVGEQAAAAQPFLPVESPEDVFLVVSPLEPGGQPHYFLAHSGRMDVYRAGGKAASQPAEPVWQVDPAPGNRFNVSIDLPAARLDGNSPPLLLIDWQGQNGQSAQLLRVEAGSLLPAGEPAKGAQFLEIDGDGLREFIAFDGAAWQVQRWDGSRFGPGESVTAPPFPQAQELQSWDTLPALPVDLWMQGQDGSWAVWPKAGGALAFAQGQPPAAPPCTAADDPCRSPDGRYDLVAVFETPEPGTAQPAPENTPSADTSLTPAPSATPTVQAALHYSAGVRALAAGSVSQIPWTRNTQAQATFAWAGDGVLWMALAGQAGGLFQVDPATGEAQPALEMALCSLSGAACPQPSTGLGALMPFVFDDGSVGFAALSTLPGAYPPPGIYRRAPDGQLTGLAKLPRYEPYCVAGRGGYSLGRLIWSPGGEAFLYAAPGACPDSPVLLGLSDGSALWDLTALPGSLRDLRFAE